MVPIGIAVYLAGFPVTGIATAVVGSALIVIEAYEYFTKPPGEDMIEEYRDELDKGTDESGFGPCEDGGKLVNI